jgi:phospholipase C
VRLSPYWEKILLVVLYDEHGGFYDHVPPPGRVPNPDGKVSLNPPFDFTRLGVRVPAVLISPWVERGRVDLTLYEHASIPATLRSLFNLPHALTARDQAANTFEKNISRRSPRTDAPTLLPVPEDQTEIKQLRKLLHVDAHAQALLHKLSGEDESHAPLTLYQQSLVELADRLNNDARANLPAQAGLIDHEHAAAVHVHESLKRFLTVR